MYKIITDSACDMTPEVLAAWGVKTIPLTFRFDDEDREYKDGEIPGGTFYGMMRAGRVAKTSGIGVQTYLDAFGAELAAGNDLLYLAFSSGLSSTCSNARFACEDLKETYPDRRAVTVDSLSASAGFGLLLYLAVQKRDAGASLDELVSFLEDTRLHLCHWYTVDDLVYLKRGGRISAATAVVGGMLNIKPVMHMDDEGHLTNVTKARGRKAAVKALADKYAAACIDKSAPVFISHGDCIPDAEELGRLITEAGGPYPEQIVFVGPVIGSHSGPGTLALFFVGNER